MTTKRNMEVLNADFKTKTIKV